MGKKGKVFNRLGSGMEIHVYGHGPFYVLVNKQEKASFATAQEAIDWAERKYTATESYTHIVWE